MSEVKNRDATQIDQTDSTPTRPNAWEGLEKYK